MDPLRRLPPMHPRLRRFLHSRGVAVKRFHSMPEARRTRILASRGVDVVFDVGANFGQYASFLRSAGYTGRIVSFEPVSATYAKLAERSSGDAGWDAHQVAVAATPGTLANLSFSSPLRPRIGTAEQLDRDAALIRTETAQADTLDNLVARLVGPNETIAVKMDVQGYETAVLDGGPETISRAQVVELELMVVPTYEGETLAPALLARMFDSGFRLGMVDNVMQDEDGTAFAIDGVFVRN
jgi:FkbM family methyltransferase